MLDSGFATCSEQQTMEKAGSFIRFMIIPAGLFFVAGLFVVALALGCVFMTIGIVRHLKILWTNRA